MRKLVLALMAALVIAQVQAAEPRWQTDLQKAQEQAKTQNKMVLVNFTGSDWCPWCIKLDQEVFSKPEFQDFANNNLVLVIVDFPRQKPQSAEQKKTNKALQEKYKVEGYPTVVVLNSKGEVAGQLGYEPGGPKPFIEKLETLKKKSS